MLYRGLESVPFRVAYGDDIPVCTEMFANDRVVWFAHFTMLQMVPDSVPYGTVQGRDTYNEFEILREREPEDCNHAFERVVRVVNAVAPEAYR